MEKKEAMKILKDFYDKSALFSVRTALDTIIPELKEIEESEDEKIRKHLINTFSIYYKDDVNGEWDGLPVKKIIAWLEKQGEQKPIEEYNITGISSKHADGKLGEMVKNMESANKIEPKFHEGEWIVGHNGDILHIEKIDNSRYYFAPNQKVSWGIAECDSKSHLWTIQDAKDGDVLSYRDGQWIFIYKEKIDNNSFYYHTLYSTIHQDLTINDAGFTLLVSAIIPATKEQRDTLIKAMTDAGYTFDFEKKELKKIEEEEYNGEDYGIDSLYHAQRILEKTLGKVDGYQTDDGILAHQCAISAIKKLYEQNPTWSEEDERSIRDSIFYLKSAKKYFEKDNDILWDEKWFNLCIEWLESLKDRVQPQQEWSEEDNKIISEVVQNYESGFLPSVIERDRIVKTLKSLKDKIQLQPKQEWSEEDKDYINDLIKYFSQNEKLKNTKEDIVIWLKSLKDRVGCESNCTTTKEWSEEDETYSNHIVTAVKSYYTDDLGKENPWRKELLRWLKSLKNRVQPKQEWGEEDESIRKAIVEGLKSMQGSFHYISSIKLDVAINWLKSLRPQNTWKPSKGQLECLGYAIEKAETDWPPLINNRIYLTLKALKEQLEKI